MNHGHVFKQCYTHNTPHYHNIVNTRASVLIDRRSSAHFAHISVTVRNKITSNYRNTLILIGNNGNWFLS